jgi:protein-tyrosine sulfotransferase
VAGGERQARAGVADESRRRGQHVSPASTRRRARRPKPRPVFIVCTARSGSTLLRYLLDSHPEIVCPPELDLSMLLDRACAPWTRRDEMRGVKPSAPGRLSTEACRRGRKVVDEVMAAFAADAGASVFVDKSLSTATYLPRVSQCYPDASYLFLYRYPLDVIASAIETFRWGIRSYIGRWVNEDTSNFVAAIGQYWIDQTSEMVSFEKSCSVAHARVRYELLCSDPSGTLKDVFNFLELGYDKKLIERTFIAEHASGAGDIKIDFTRAISTESIGRGSAVPQRLTRGQVEEINTLLAQLDYPSLEIAWNGHLADSLGLRPAEAASPDPARVAKEVVAVLRTRESRPMSTTHRAHLPLDLVVWTRASGKEARLVLGTDGRVKLAGRAVPAGRRVRFEGDVLLRIVTGQTALLSAYDDNLVRFEPARAGLADPRRPNKQGQLRKTASVLAMLLTPDHSTGLSRTF